MPRLWSEGTGEAYVKRKSSELLEFLEERRMIEDDPWVTLAETCKHLLLTEYALYGILTYLWLQDKIGIKEGPDGELLLSILWENDYPKAETGG